MTNYRLCFQLWSRHEAACGARQPFDMSWKHFSACSLLNKCSTQDKLNLKHLICDEDISQEICRLKDENLSLLLEQIFSSRINHFICRRSKQQKEIQERALKRKGKKMAQIKQRKVALMGFRSVGKSSLAIQFVQVSVSPLPQNLTPLHLYLKFSCALAHVF